MEKFCYQCKRDNPYQRGDSDEGCPIIVMTMLYNPGDKEYPPEWICDDNCGLAGTRCTAFEEINR